MSTSVKNSDKKEQESERSGNSFDQNLYDGYLLVGDMIRKTW